MRDNEIFYEDEDQNSIMGLIDSRDWPDEQEDEKSWEERIQYYTDKINVLRKRIENAVKENKDVKQLISILTKAEAMLNLCIDAKKDKQEVENDTTALPY